MLNLFHNMTYPEVFLARWADSERIQTARMAKLWELWRYLHNLKVFYTLNTIILQILFLFTKRFYCQKKKIERSSYGCLP